MFMYIGTYSDMIDETLAVSFEISSGFGSITSFFILVWGVSKIPTHACCKILKYSYKIDIFKEI